LIIRSGGGIAVPESRLRGPRGAYPVPSSFANRVVRDMKACHFKTCAAVPLSVILKSGCMVFLLGVGGSGGLHPVLSFAGEIHIQVKDPDRKPPSQGQTSSPQSSSDEAYLIQLNSFRDPVNAQKFVGQLKRRGYSPFIVTTQGEKPWYKIRVGPYPTREEAIQSARELKKIDGVATLIMREKNFSLPADETRTLVFSEMKEPEVVDDTHPEATGSEGNRGESAPPASGKTLARKADEGKDSSESIDEVVSQFLIWIKAWQDKEVELYLSFYSQEFQAPGPLGQWKRSRQIALERNHQIHIEVGDIRLRDMNDRIEMTFVQDFQSDTVADHGQKTLVWRKEGAEWKIISEKWEPV